MFVVRGTKKFLDRAGKVDATDQSASTTVLGDWYATVWFWKPQAALFVNERTLLPVLLPMAPASTVVERFAFGVREVFQGYELDPRFVEAEVAAMGEHRLDKTASQSVLGVMNEFKHLAENYRYRHDTVDLDDLSRWLAHVVLSPLFTTEGFPDRELQAVVAQHLS